MKGGSSGAAPASSAPSPRRALSRVSRRWDRPQHGVYAIGQPVRAEHGGVPQTLIARIIHRDAQIVHQRRHLREAQMQAVRWRLARAQNRSPLANLRFPELRDVWLRRERPRKSSLSKEQRRRSANLLRGY